MTSSRLQALEWIYDRNYIHSRLDGLSLDPRPFWLARPEGSGVQTKMVSWGTHKLSGLTTSMACKQQQ